GALAWSGSWRITVEQDQLDEVRVTGGFNPFDFGYVLHPGQSFDTPVFYGGYAANGLGSASRLLRHFESAHVLPHRIGTGDSAAPKPRPVIYNSWEATEFNVDEAGQMALAEKAAALGVDRFVMDDGWFGQRKDDHAGLGDWYVNQQKFPHGLKPLIDKVHSLKMDFGLWVEPEMVNPDSDLYRKHPEWDQLPPAEQKKVYVEFTRNLYSILAELQRKHPKVELESCSGGGGRVDLGILRYADEVWP